MRVNFVNLILGKRGTGKTIFTQQVIEAYHAKHPTQKILIMDTLDHPAYGGVSVITADMLSRWNRANVYRIFQGNPDENLSIIQRSMNNALIVFEDAGKYIKKNLQVDVRQFIIDSKQKNLDLLFIFHGFANTPPEIFGYTDTLTLFKVGASPEYRKSEIYNFEEIFEAWKKVNDSKNPYEKITIRIN